jgi:hypothetical protein
MLMWNNRSLYNLYSSGTVIFGLKLKVISPSRRNDSIWMSKDMVTYFNGCFLYINCVV